MTPALSTTIRLDDDGNGVNVGNGNINGDGDDDFEIDDIPLMYNDSSSLRHKLNSFYESIIIPNMGVFLTLISQMFNSIMLIFCKLLLMDPDFDKPLHPLQILFVRMSITYVGCIIYFTIFNRDPNFPLGPKGYRLYMIGRGVGGFIGVGGQYWSLMYLTVSDSVCITFLAPTITSLMAYFFLREHFTRVEAIGGMVAFLGVILIAKPTFLFGSPSGASASSATDKLTGSLFAFFSTFGTGVAMCSIRKIGFHAHPLLTVSFYALITIIASFIGILILPDLSFQMPHTFKQWFLLTVIGVAGFVMQFLLTAGMQREKAARAIAMAYTQLIYASVFDFFIYGHFPTGLSLIGEIIIVLSVISILYFKEKTKHMIISGTNNNDIELQNDNFSIGTLNTDDYDNDARSMSLSSLPSKD